MIKIITFTGATYRQYAQITLHHCRHGLGSNALPQTMRCLNKPTYPEMVVIHKEIYQNLATILSPFGTSHAGYLGIMMLGVLYVQCFNDPFQPSINPGEYPDNIPAIMSKK